MLKLKSDVDLDPVLNISGFTDSNSQEICLQPKHNQRHRQEKEFDSVERISRRNKEHCFFQISRNRTCSVEH